MQYIIFKITISAADVFYNIAHGTNSIGAVDWAISQGANAVELDLDFSRSGQPRAFNHGPYCDCFCRCPAPFTRLCLRDSRSVCYPLREDFTFPCLAEIAVDVLLPYVASRPEIALVYIDSKLEDNDDLVSAGNDIIVTVENLLFDKGYLGKVIIGAFSFDKLDYLGSAAIKGKLISPFGSRIYLTLENGILNPFAQSVGFMQTLLEGIQVIPVIYGTGKSSCLPLSLDQEALELAAINKAGGVISMAYTWTVDSIRSIENDLDYVNGIITNYPSRVRDVIESTGRRLATTDDELPRVSTTELVLDSSSYDCECDFSQAGCIIRTPAPAGLACKCERTPGNPPQCSGKFVLCRDSENPKCASPDISLESCELGGGNCDGY